MIYCFRCKQKTENTDEKEIFKHRAILMAKCAVCGCNKSQIKKKEK